jgi:hypothetical protein
MDHIYFVWVASNRFEDGHAFDIEIDDLEATMTIICSGRSTEVQADLTTGRLLTHSCRPNTYFYAPPVTAGGRFLTEKEHPSLHGLSVQV